MGLVRPDRLLCIFDLDGTLIDSLEDIANALNYGLQLLGLPPRSVASCRYLVGEGVPRLCERALAGQRMELLGRLIDLVRARYRAFPLTHTCLYAGVAEAALALHQRGQRLAVLTNKPHELACRVVERLWPDAPLVAVQGYVAEQQRKPDPTHALAICARAAVAPAQACLIGDTPTDIETARRAGMVSIGVTWGFRTRAELEDAGADHIVEAPAELLPLLQPG